MPKLKLNFKDEMHTTVVEKDIIGFSDLVAEARGLFSAIAENSAIFFTWLDEDRDRITCKTDKGVEAAMAFFSGHGKTAIFEVVEIQVSFNFHFEYTRMQS